MTLTEILIIASFVAGLIPTVVLLILHGLRTNWTHTVAGRAMVAMETVTVISYALSVLTLSFPGFFHDETGEWFRIVVRFMLSLVFWNLLLLFFRAQRNRPLERDDTPAGGSPDTDA